MQNKEIAVDTSTLVDDITDLQEALDEITDNLDKMFDEILALDTMWEGPAKQIFMEQFAKDTIYAHEICETLQNLVECMTYAKNQYDTCENEISSIISAI